MTDNEVKTIVEKAEQAIEEARAMKAEVLKERAALQTPSFNEGSAIDYRFIENELANKRTVTLNGAGSVSFVSELFKAALQKSKIASRVRVNYGASSSTVIPVLAPRPAVPSEQAEGATGISADSTAALSGKTIQPKAFFSELPISYEALKMGAANLEAELPQIFRDAFVTAMDNGIVAGGSSAAIKGIFTTVPAGNKIACGAAGLPKIEDMVNLAERLNDYDLDSPVIVISPTVHAALLAETGSVYDFIKEELARNKSILGVEVIVTGKAPSTLTAGSVIAWGGSLSNYCVGIAADLTIEPIRVPGSTVTHYQAVMAMGGTPVVDGNMFALKTV